MSRQATLAMGVIRPCVERREEHANTISTYMTEPLMQRAYSVLQWLHSSQPRTMPTLGQLPICHNLQHIHIV